MQPITAVAASCSQGSILPRAPLPPSAHTCCAQKGPAPSLSHQLGRDPTCAHRTPVLIAQRERVAGVGTPRLNLSFEWKVDPWRGSSLLLHCLARGRPHLAWGSCAGGSRRLFWLLSRDRSPPFLTRPSIGIQGPACPVHSCGYLGSFFLACCFLSGLPASEDPAVSTAFTAASSTGCDSRAAG